MQNVLCTLRANNMAVYSYHKYNDKYQSDQHIYGKIEPCQHIHGHKIHSGHKEYKRQYKQYDDVQCKVML